MKSLDVQAKVFLDAINRSNRTPLPQLGAIKARDLYAQRPKEWAPDYVDIKEVMNIDITSCAHKIPIRLYKPHLTLKQQPTNLPTILFYHGGGMVIGSLDGYDTLCRQLCHQTKCLVISVDYRLAPEHKFPSAAEDAFMSYQWVVEHIASFGGDPQKVILCGDSAGGTLAAVTALLARDRSAIKPILQILLYPAVASYADSDSHYRYGQGYFLERDTVLWFHESYIRSDNDRQDFRYAPLIAKSLKDLPPTYVVVAGFDTLRDEGVAYAKRLREEGVEVTLKEYEGMFHPFISLAGILDEGKRAISECTLFIRNFLTQSPQ